MCEVLPRLGRGQAQQVVPVRDLITRASGRNDVTVRDRDVEIDYDVEERDGQRRGVARLRLPEKIARTLTQEEIPQLDRPVRGFSYWADDAPLDMRMDSAQTLTAA